MVSMRSLFAYFWVDKPRVIYFVLCCLIILVLVKKRQELFARKLFRYIVFPAVILLVILLNPVVAHLLVTKYTETQALRFFWLIPVSLLLSVVTVRLVCNVKNRKQKILFTILALVVLSMFSDDFEHLRGTWQNRITNAYKIPSVVVQLDDWIMNDDADVSKSAVFPQPLNLWVRQYRPEIELPYAWTSINQNSEEAKQLYRILEKQTDTIDLREVAYWAQKGGYSYIVLDTSKDYKGTLESYQEVFRVDTDTSKDTNAYDREYVVYRLKEEG